MISSRKGTHRQLPVTSLIGNNGNIGRLAKNSVYMYLRMILVMLVSLYSSRIILQNLGIEDFGIYNVVGSIVVMFHSVKTIFTSSTQRYMNYEMGRGNSFKKGCIHLTAYFPRSVSDLRKNARLLPAYSTTRLQWFPSGDHERPGWSEVNTCCV